MDAKERRRRVLAVFVGFPGFGKTSFAALIAEALGVPRLRLSGFLKECGLVTASGEAGSPELHYAQLLLHTDRYLAEAVAPCLEEHGWAVLDGFPRSVQEAEALGALVAQAGASLVVFHFGIVDQGAQAAISLARQRERDLTRGRSLNEHWYAGKVQLAVTYDRPTLDRLQAQGARIVSLDPRAPKASIERAVRTALRLDFERVPWDRELLRIIRDSTETGMLAGEAFFRPFFDGRWGPVQVPRAIEVVVATPAEVEPAYERLKACFPCHHLRIFCEGAFPEPLDIHRGRVGLDAEGNLQVVIPPGVEAGLRRGIVQPPTSSVTVEEEVRSAARALVRFYPGLRASCIGHAPVPVLPGWLAIQRATQAMERGGRRLWAELSPEEGGIAQELRVFVTQADKHASAPPRPLFRRAEPDDPWRARDADFWGWLLMRELHPSTEGVLAKALAEVADVPQKPTHQGWMTDQHVFAVLLQLSTNQLPKHYWRAVRIAALYHDHGKRQDVATPGAHPLIGQRLWNEQYRDDWAGELTEEEEHVIPFLIANHDLLGRLARGVKEERFAGGIDPVRCRDRLHQGGLPFKVALDLVEALNRADIAAVAALRWTLPELDFARRLVLEGVKLGRGGRIIS